MKYILLFLSFWGLTHTTYAQQLDFQCPNIAWHKPIAVGYENLTSGNWNLKWLLPIDLRPQYLNYQYFFSPHLGFKIETQQNGKLLMASNYYNYLQIDNRTINNTHGRVTGAFMEGDADGNITWLQTANSSGRAAYQPNNIHFEGVNGQKHLILMHNQASSFNNQNYSSSFINITSRLLLCNSTYSLISLDSNNQTINRFSIPHLRLQNLKVDSLGNIYLIGAYDTTITLGGQQYTPQRGITPVDPFYGRLTDMVVIKLNPQYQVLWAVPIIGRGDEYNYLIQLDQELNVYVAGTLFTDTLTIGNYTTIRYLSGGSIYLAQLSNAGTVNWVKQWFGGSGIQPMLDLEIDPSGNVLLLAGINHRNYYNNDTFGTYKIPEYNTILFRYNPRSQTSDYLVLQGSGDNIAMDMVLHPTDNYVYLVGGYTDTLFLPNNTYKISSNSQSSGFVARVQTDAGNLKLDWFHDIQSDSFSCITSIAVAKDGGLYITGVTKGNYSFLGNTYTVNPTYIPHFYAKLVGLNTAITFDGTTYTALETQASSYQWLDCNNNMQPVSGATNRTFTPASPGSYAVALSNGYCQAVSECLGVTSITTPLMAQAKIYPNPFKHSLSIAFPPAYAHQKMSLQITDLSGRRIGQYIGTPLQLNQYLAEQSPKWAANQMYTIQIIAHESQASTMFKIVKE